MIGLGTMVNVLAIVAGGGIGLLVGARLNERARELVTDILGLTTLVIGGFAVVSAGTTALAEAAGSGVLVVLGSLLLGGLAGSYLRLEDRIESGANALRVRLQAAADGRFAEGLVTASLVFCVGPLAILGSLSDGLGRGAEQLLVKAVLDGFAAMVFAASLGVGVLFAAAVVGVYQGLWTLLGYMAGDVLAPAQIDALTATGGVMLLGLGLRLLNVKQVRVGDLLPALVVAPLIVSLVALVR